MTPEAIGAIREKAVQYFSGAMTEKGMAAAIEGRFSKVIFTRDFSISGLLILEKPQNGELPLILDGIRRSLETSARYQGVKLDPQTSETPDEMPHEIHDQNSPQDRLAEIRKNGGPVVEVDGHLEMVTYWARDSNVLWNSLFSRYVQETSDWGFRDKLWPNFEASLRWMRQWGDIDQDLLIEGPHNQWWKDSETSLVDEESHIPHDPIAAIDVNSFACLSDLASAWLYDSKGDYKTAHKLRVRALRRKDLINKLFWIEDVGLYAPAIDSDKLPIKIVTSDSVFPLWVGIPNDPQARKIVNRLMQPDLLTKWGPRSRSRNSTQYDPKEYQNGNVWHQLAAIAAAGCERYGLLQEAAIFDDRVFNTSERFGFPELSVVDDQDNVSPYEEKGMGVSCNPQTWVLAGVLNRTAK